MSWWGDKIYWEVGMYEGIKNNAAKDTSSMYLCDSSQLAPIKKNKHQD